VGSIGNVDAVDLENHVAGAKTRFCRLAALTHIKRLDRSLVVYPGDTVVRKAEFPLLIEIDNRSNDRGEREYGQDRRRKLKLEFLKHSGSPGPPAARDTTFDGCKLSTFAASC
jgi:hypothetical protein